MAVYTVHAPADAASGQDADRVMFLRDGFHFWAMVFGPLWLLWHRLWLALFGYLVVMVALTVALSLLGAGGNVRNVVMLLLAVLMGMEAASLRRWSYSRRKWRLVDFVVADNELAAERRFFERSMTDASTGAPSVYTVPQALHQPYAGTSQQGVIGLFPEPGGSR